MRLIDVITPLAPPLCAGCDGWAGRSAPICGHCRREIRRLAPRPARLGGGRLEVWGAVAYEGPVRGLVRTFKFRAAPGLAPTLAGLMVAGAPPGWLVAGTTVLLPVPLHPERRRRRGYDQARRLAEAIAERCGGATVATGCLERRGPTGTQVGRTREKRLHALARAYVVREAPPPGPLVLVDDVVTTGATVQACAQALCRAGVEVPRAIAFARTPGR